MGQAKPTIRAPKLSLQQEINEKQQDAFLPPLRPVEHILPKDASTISPGNLLTSFFSRNFLVTIGGIVALIILVLVMDTLNAWWKVRGRPHHSTAAAFKLPPEIENPRVPVSGNPPAYNVMAEACYIEGNKLLAAGFTYRAEKMFRQAAEHSPDNQKYWDAWQALRREADFDIFHRQMEALLDADRDNEAWEAYVNGVGRDRRFFNRFTPDFAERLVKAGHLASAASILMTYNELFPVNSKVHSLLEQIRKAP